MAANIINVYMIHFSVFGIVLRLRTCKEKKGITTFYRITTYRLKMKIIIILE